MTFPVLPPFHVGLVVAIASGFCFGFVLERAGFGRAQKLVGQFYGYDLSVFKVMFTAVVTAMTVVLLASAAGLTEFKVIADHAASATWLVPFVAGGIVVGMGFVMSGYCPGTSWVAMGSGKVDGLFTVVGSMLGGLVWSELEGRPGFAAFHNATYLGSFYLWELFHLPARAGPAIVGAAVVAMAVACFALAERVERALAGRADPLARGTPGGRPRRFVISGLAAGAAAALALLLVPVGTQAVPSPAQLSAADLARRVLEEPWSVRVVDLRRREACAARRVPGAECVPEPELGKLGLADASPARDLVLVADGSLAATPPAAGAFPGRVLALSGGWKAWEEYALAPPPPPAAGADPAAREAFRLRAGLQSALTGMKAAPPPPAPSAAPAGPRRSGGGCSG